MLENNGFTIEDIRSVARRAKLLNTLLIVGALVYFITIFLFNEILAFSDPTLFLIVLKLVSSILAIIILVFSILSFRKMSAMKIEGGGQLLASSIIFTIFALFSFVLGLLIIILSGMSIRKIKESVEILEIENGGKY
jgi:hypothetical protein